MNMYERLCQFVQDDLIRFCPLCGKELVDASQELAVLPVTRTMIDIKTCPDGDGAFTGQFSVQGPDPIFEVNKDLYQNVE